MNRTFKILAIMIMVVMLVMVATPVFASGFKPAEIVQGIEDSANKNASTDTGFNTMAGKIVAFIRNLAVVAGVILLSLLGIKFMMGSPEEKSDYKKSLVPLAVGIIIVMAAAQIVTMVFSFVA